MRRRAFTLLEVLLVVALLATVAVMVWPDFGTAERAERLDESARRMKSLLSMCRAEAMLQSRRYRVEFRPDGTLYLTRQLDPLYGPHLYVPVKSDWAGQPVLLEDVWVESVLPMSGGSTPIEIEDEQIEYLEDQTIPEEPTPIEELGEPLWLDFEPDGRSASLRWTLRDISGRGRQLTLDGRLGRVLIEPAERLEAELVQKPEPMTFDEPEPIDEAEVVAELKDSREP